MFSQRKKLMNTPQATAHFKVLRVARVQDITPHFRRVVLTGADLQDFPQNCQGDHIKLLISESSQTLSVNATHEEQVTTITKISQNAIKRIYTVAEYDAQNQELSVDFVLHGDNGPASAWASRATEGHLIGVIGPKGRERFVLSADWFLLAGDLSGLAAMKSVIKALPKSAQGYIFIEVESAADVQQLEKPDDVKLEWFVRHHTSASKSRLLYDAVKNLEWQSGRLSVTLAGESEQVIMIRKYLRTEKSMSHDMMYAIPYWKDKCNEDQYHDQRHKVMADLN